MENYFFLSKKLKKKIFKKYIKLLAGLNFFFILYYILIIKNRFEN